MTASPRPLVVKFGGELVEAGARLDRVVSAIAAALARKPCPLVIVHGGGKEIDAALKASGIEKRQVEGLRVTDAQTLDVVVSVLAGLVNTRLVAALTAVGAPAVGLTGADGACGLSNPAPPHRTLEGALVDLGRVGEPIGNGDSRLLRTLLDGGFVPVIASIGMDQGGQLLNVNADTLASHVAGTLKASRLAIGGTTAGVLDQAGATIRDLDTLAIERLVGSGTATAGMIAKLRACERAVAAGVDDVVVFDARDAASVNLVVEGAVPTSATRIAAAAAATRH